MIYVLDYPSEQLVVYLGAGEVGPDLVLGEPVSPELDGILETLKGGFSAEDDGIGDLEGLGEGGTHKFLVELDESGLVVG